MRARGYDVVFVGGGLSALLLLNELLPALPGRVAVVDPSPLADRPPVHWSYWGRGRTVFDRFAVGAWRRARVAHGPPEPIAPFTLRLVRSDDVFAYLAAPLGAARVEWLHAAARSISRRGDGLYEVATDGGTVCARRVFDGACDVAPVFPSPDGPRAVLSGTGIRVTADRPVFDPATATLFDPLDELSFAYLLPLSPVEALVESASFGTLVWDEDPAPLLRHLLARHPGAHFAVTHVESGSIPLGFAPPETAGPGHVLIGTKRGLVKPSSGFGVVRIAEENGRLARLWQEHRQLPPSRRTSWHWRMVDRGFLRLAARDPRRPPALLHRVMREVPLAHSLRFLDENLPPRRLAPILVAALPVVLRRP